jgi:hypothetical protein
MHTCGQTAQVYVIHNNQEPERSLYESTLQIVRNQLSFFVRCDSFILSVVPQSFLSHMVRDYDTLL